MEGSQLAKKSLLHIVYLTDYISETPATYLSAIIVIIPDVFVQITFFSERIFKMRKILCPKGDGIVVFRITSIDSQKKSLVGKQVGFPS